MGCAVLLNLDPRTHIASVAEQLVVKRLSSTHPFTFLTFWLWFTWFPLFISFATGCACQGQPDRVQPTRRHSLSSQLGCWATCFPLHPHQVWPCVHNPWQPWWRWNGGVWAVGGCGSCSKDSTIATATRQISCLTSTRLKCKCTSNQSPLLTQHFGVQVSKASISIN